MDLPKLWGLISADLARARNSLPNHAASHKVIAQYQEFLNHNELELACDMLEAYAEEQEVSKEFWVSLRDAAARMQDFLEFGQRAVGYNAVPVLVILHNQPDAL